MRPTAALLAPLSAMIPTLALALAAAPPAAGAATQTATLAIAQPETATTGRLDVTSRAFDPDGPIPIMYARQGKSISPPLTWGEHPPAHTKSFVMLAEDADALQTNRRGEVEPFTHWILFDMNSNASGLPRAVKVGPDPKNVAGAHQGRNALGTLGYSGPTPPQADPAHHYHFEVFALDRMLKLAPGVDRATVVRAMAGHVLAKGEMVGLYKYRPEKPEVPALFPNG